MAPLGEGAELPRLEGGGAGRGAQAQPPRRQRDPGLRRPSSHKQNALGKLCSKKSWEGAFVFFPPRVPTFFSKGDSGSLFSPAASSPTLPSPGRRARVRLPAGTGRKERAASLSQALPRAGRARQRLLCPWAGAGRSGSSPRAGLLTLPHLPPWSPGARRRLRLMAAQKWRWGSAASKRDKQRAGERNRAGVGEY